MNKIKGAFCAVAILSVIGILGGCSFATKTNYTYENGDKYTAGDREITENIENIDIDYLSGNVKVTGSDSDSVLIKETCNIELDDKRKVHTWVDGNTLYVRYCASANRLDLNNLKKQLVIELPQSVDLNDVKVEVSSADVNCSELVAQNVNVSASSGDIAVDMEADVFKIHASSGNIFLTPHGNSENIELDTSSGNIDVIMDSAEKMSASASSGCVTVDAGSVKEFKARMSSGDGQFSFRDVPENMDIEASSGNVTIYLPEAADLTADFDVTSGKVNYEQAFAKEGDTYVCGSGQNQMKVHTSSGDINVKKLSE